MILDYKFIILGMEMLTVTHLLLFPVQICKELDAISHLGTRRTEGVILASTPAQSHPNSMPPLPKTGPPKPPRIKDAVELQTSTGVRLDADDGYGLEAEQHPANVLSDDGEGEVSTVISDNDKNKDEYSYTLSSAITDRGTPASSLPTKGHVRCDRRWLRMSASLHTPTSTHCLMPAAMLHKGPSVTFLDSDDVRDRRRSTGTLDVSSAHGSLLVTPETSRGEESKHAPPSWGLCTPGADKSLFGVSRTDSCLLTPEKAEIEAMLQWIDNAFPPSLTYSGEFNELTKSAFNTTQRFTTLSICSFCKN